MPSTSHERAIAELHHALDHGLDLDEHQAAWLAGLVTQVRAATTARGADAPIAAHALAMITSAYDSAIGNACPFTVAHTRHWCGYPRCRDA